MTTTVIRATLLSDGNAIPDGWLLFDAGGITDIGSGPAPAAHQTITTEYLTAGFIDLHCHGGAGHAFDDGKDAILAARDYHLRHGTTASMVSLVTASIDDLVVHIGQVRAAAASSDQILGVHLEGPWLAASRRGAHDLDLLDTPTPSAIERLRLAASELPRMITIAPELPGAMGAIEALAHDGWIVAIGHTDAEVTTGDQAIQSGARIITHALNGMRGLAHRSPGVVPAAFDDRRVTLEVIADGLHIHPRMINLLFHNAPGRIALITDAMAASGCADGHWKLGSQAVEVRDGVARLAGEETIAGSTATQDVGLRVAVQAGVPLPAAVQALTSVPAAAMGMAERYGSLQVGRRADLVLLDEQLDVQQVFVAGKAVS